MGNRAEQPDSNPITQDPQRSMAVLTQSPLVSSSFLIVVSDEAAAHRLWRALTRAERARVVIQWARVHVLSGNPQLAGISQPPPVDPEEDVIQRDLTYD